MNGTEFPYAHSLREDSTRLPREAGVLGDGLVLGLSGLGLFAVLGVLGLVLSGILESRAAGRVGAAAPERDGQVLTWTPPLELAGGVPEVLPGAVRQAQDGGTPLVLVASGIAEWNGGAERSLILECDGTLRCEEGGELVGFLWGGGSPALGEWIPGPWFASVGLLHPDSWLVERASVPVVESDGSGGWVVLDYIEIELGLRREPLRDGEEGLGRISLHPRTGLPRPELVAYGR